MPLTATNLSCSETYAKASPELIKEICNGCGAANAKFDFVPDTILLLPIGEACDIHDWRYYEAKDATHEKKLSADREYLNNLLRIINTESKFKIIMRLRRWVAHFNYRMVDRFGGPAFWEGKN